MKLNALDIRIIAERTMNVAALMDAHGIPGVCMVDDGGFTSSITATLTTDQATGLAIELQRLAEVAPKGMTPITVNLGQDGVIDIRIAGTTLPERSFQALLTALGDQAAIEGMRASFPEGEHSSYIFGHPGRMNADKRICTIWAHSPAEAIVKFMAMRSPGFARDPMSAVARDIHEDGRIEMRDLSSWAIQDIDALVPLIREAVALHVDERDMDLDWS